MKKIQFSSFGFSSILLMFVMICIVTFSTLTLVTANSDYKLSKKVAEKSTQYYQAEEQLYEKLADLDITCKNAYKTAVSKEDYYLHLGLTESTSVKYTSPINDYQNLEAEFEVLYPDKNTTVFVRVKRWVIVNNPVEFEEGGLNLLGQ